MTIKKPLNKSKNISQDFEFIGKALLFPKHGILAIGDLHLGYENMLRESGNIIPKTQINQTIEELEEIIKRIKSERETLKKIIFLGDVKHYFAYNKAEKNNFLKIILALEKYIKRENIIIIKGNHEKMANIADKPLLDYYIYKNIAFIHGDLEIKEVFNNSINYIVMGHLHPAIKITDSQKIRAEKYKCFLIGKYKQKQFFILPSFLQLVEGTSLNEHISDKSCIIPKEYLKKFEVILIGEKEFYNFGKLKNIK